LVRRIAGERIAGVPAAARRHGSSLARPGPDIATGDDRRLGGEIGERLENGLEEVVAVRDGSGGVIGAVIAGDAEFLEDEWLVDRLRDRDVIGQVAHRATERDIPCGVRARGIVPAPVLDPQVDREVVQKRGPAHALELRAGPWGVAIELPFAAE